MERRVGKRLQSYSIVIKYLLHFLEVYVNAFINVSKGLGRTQASGVLEVEALWDSG